MNIFLSSTYKDLVREREAVYKALQAAGHHVVRMEDFGSQDGQPVDACLDALAHCDLYVLIVGGRYGSIYDPVNASYTEIEYDHALEHSIPVHAYIAADFEARNSSEPLDEHPQRQLTFRRRILKLHTVSLPFTDPADLSEKVLVDIGRLAERPARRSMFPPTSKSISDPVAYAIRGARFTRLQLAGARIVIADIAVLRQRVYPDRPGNPMRRKVREIKLAIDRTGANAVIFNEIPSTAGTSLVNHRISIARDNVNIVICLVRTEEDLVHLKKFVGGAAEIWAWVPDYVELDADLDDLPIRFFTSEQFKKCGLALDVISDVDSRLDEIAIRVA